MTRPQARNSGDHTWFVGPAEWTRYRPDMAGLARVIVAHHPHHVTPRDRRQVTFLADGDYLAHIELMGE